MESEESRGTNLEGSDHCCTGFALPIRGFSTARRLGEGGRNEKEKGGEDYGCPNVDHLDKPSL